MDTAIDLCGLDTKQQEELVIKAESLSQKTLDWLGRMDASVIIAYLQEQAASPAGQWPTAALKAQLEGAC